MTWAKLDDRFIGDPTLLALPRGVRLLYVEALVWCCQQETDGAIPTFMLPRFSDEPDPATAAGAMVAAGLWSVTETGWEIVGFLDDQPSAADIEKVRELTRARQRKQRQHRDGDHSLCDPKYCRQALSRVTDGVTNGGSNDYPTRPDPTRPIGRGGDGRPAGRTP